MSHEQRGPSSECHPETTAHTEINNSKSDGTGAASPVQAFFSTPPDGSMLDWALAYARRGWAVIPLYSPRPGRACSCGKATCESQGKHPQTSHGVKDATKNEETIRLWWSAWPDANVGIACGPESGIDVLDVDGDEGRATLAHLEQQHGPLPTTLRSTTGSGGSHIVFAHRPDAALNNSVKFADSLDTRGHGGYIVAPPSRHVSGGDYRWDEGRGPADMPLQPTSDWLVALVQERAKAGKTAKSSRKTRDKNAAATSAKPALDIDLVVKGVPAGERDVQLFREACRLRERGLRRDEAEVMILGFAQRCDPPFPVDQALAKVKSAYRYTVEAAKDPEAIEKAREVVADVTKRAAKDHGAVFEAEARRALSLIRAVDPPTWARTQQALKKAGVKLRALDDSLADDEGADASCGDRKSQADRLLEIGNTADLFHTPDQGTYARVPVGEHHETLKLRSPSFKAWLTRAYYLAEERTPSAQAVADAINMLSGRAWFDGPELLVYTRLAEHEGKVYLDLTNEKWEAIEITPSGWSVVTDPPVRFRRANGMLPIPYPVRGGSIADLFAFVNVPDDADRKLVTGWLLGTLRPIGPYWGLVVQGEQGSAKSTLSQALRRLIDPATVPLRAPPKDERDLLIAAQNGWALAFDNLSGMSIATSDALCRLLTGSGFSTRELFSDDGEVLFGAARPIILNGIDTIATRPDLAERSLILHLPSIPKHARRREEEVLAGLDETRPGIVGALLDAACAALKNVGHTTLPQLPRMADAACWVVAAESTLGWTPGSFMSAYDTNQAEAADSGLESDPVGLALVGLLRHAATVTGADGSISALGPNASTLWKGTAGDLLDALTERVPERTRRSKEWPTCERVLSNRVRRLEPPLRAQGYEVERRKIHGERTMFFRCLVAPGSAAVPSDPSAPDAFSLSDGALDGAQERAPKARPTPTPLLCTQAIAGGAEAGGEGAVQASARPGPSDCVRTAEANGGAGDAQIPPLSMGQPWVA